jgi:two-component system LytT family response regulator
MNLRLIRAVIVDDEAPARRRLRTLLARETDVAVSGEAVDGPAAVQLIRERQPDLVFLDVQMPEMSGFDVLRELGMDAVPVVVFVTAYDRFALQAFDAHALDYLLKPFTNDRFRDTLARARRVLAREDDVALHRRLAALIDGLDVHAAAPRLVVKTGDRVTFLEAEAIDWIEGAGNYVRIHAGNTEHLVRDTLKAMSERLGDRRFIRVHHSHIVNVDRIRELRPWTHGEYIVVLADGTRLTSSRNYSAALRQLVERSSADSFPRTRPDHPAG